jgi:TPR repeat protein
VPQSFNEARRWMEIAALTGNVSAMTALGDMYRRGQLGPENHAMALVHYRKAAALGHTDAMNNIGMAYMRGQGVDQDPQQGVSWLSLASEQGNPYAAYQLGRAFLVGWGVEKNLAQAVAFFRLSAQRNFLDAYNYLGDALQSDEDTSVQDLPQALASYIIAREAGLLRDTIESREETGRAIANIETLTARMTAEQRAEGERIASDWIEQYGLLDFELVNE